MDRKKPLYHLLIRLGILILVLIAVFKINSDELAFFLSQVYCLFLLVEMIYFFVKKKKNLALINLALLIIIEILPVLVLIRLLV